MHALSPEPKSSLTVWAVTDNKPGHQNQVEGLIAALSNYRNVNISWLHSVSYQKYLDVADQTL